jgi:23S rRNA pseudouridine1911/1915/1917 synthase
MPPIIYEDKDLIVINKPPGLVVHGDGKSPEKTLVDFLLEAYPKIKNVGEEMVVTIGKEQVVIPRPGIVHRLDRDTSGAMVVAKNKKTFEHLKEAFKNHEVKKTYHAFLFGSLKEDTGSINEPIGRSRSDVRKWSTGKSARGELREAETSYEVLSRMGVTEVKGSTEEGTYTYIKATPRTGRTHQLRVHFKYLNHPIIADSIYAPGRKNKLGFKRLALHARTLVFLLPNGKEITVEAPFPDDFEKAIKFAKKGLTC